MASIITWLGLHWKDVLESLIAIDVAVIKIFPNAGILGKIKDVLTSVDPQS